MRTTRLETTLRSENRLKLGLFASNCSSGMAVTTVPERWRATWQDNLALGQMADQAGIEFMLPIARWKGFEGESGFQDSSLETIAWACGLLASTKRINVLGTLHVPFVNPVFAAKQIVTVDHIGEGRFGLNIVSGWNEDEFRMLGVDLADHDRRYDFSAEWLTLVRKIWNSTEPFDWNGEFFQLAGVVGEPKPWGGTDPIVMSAGSSPAGRAFAAANCDCIFVVLTDWDSAPGAVEQIRTAATDHPVEVFASAYIVCRPTTAEAEEYHRYYAEENGDWQAVDKIMSGISLQSKSLPPEYYQAFRTRFAGGHGTFPIIGDPDTVASELKRMSDIGVAGCTLTFVDFLAEFPYFRDEVLPRLERLGVRGPAVESTAS